MVYVLQWFYTMMPDTKYIWCQTNDYPQQQKWLNLDNTQKDLAFLFADESVNPIVNADYQICTDFNKNRNTFPKRLKSNQATPK